MVMIMGRLQHTSSYITDSPPHSCKYITVAEFLLGILLYVYIVGAAFGGSCRILNKYLYPYLTDLNGRHGGRAFVCSAKGRQFGYRHLYMNNFLFI